MIAPRSACIGCPFHGNGWWRNISDEDLADAADFERTVQATTELTKAVPYLHRDCIPIEQVVARLRAQGTLFGEDIAAECGGSCHT